MKVAIIGSGNIGTDLMIKILRTSKVLEMSVMVGIDPESDGLARARRMGVATCHTGIKGLVEMEEWKDIKMIFDATSAKAHHYNYEVVKQYPDKRIIDLTPAAIGPYLVPPVNFDDNIDVKNVNMVTCGGQATIPMVAAVSRIAKVHYGEIVASIASKSAGPGTRANIDEFTETTSLAIEKVGGAERGKAIIVGYTLHQEVQFDDISEDAPVFIEGLGYRHGLKTTVLLQVRGAGHYLPEYAGNLDIMTSAALATGEKLCQLD